MTNSDKENCKNLNDELEFFQNLVCDIVTRQVVFKKFETEMKTTALTQGNDFIALIWYGYIISQLSDCRKFFDRDGNAHSFQFVVQHVEDSILKNEHSKLRTSWKDKNLETIINKYMLHADMRVREITTEVSVKNLNDFISSLEAYLKNIVDDLTKRHFGINSLNYDAYLGERENEVAAFFNEVRK